MEEQDGKLSGIAGGGRANRNCREADGAYQAGLHHSAITLHGCGGSSNPRVYKALRDQLVAVLDELRRIEAGSSVDDELMDTIQMIASIMDGMKEDSAYDE